MNVTPKEASKYFNVAENTLRSWSNQGKIKCIKTKGGHRRYYIPKNNKEEKQQFKPISIIYARVSSSKQRSDLQRQSQFLKQKYPQHQLITDIGSGINFKRKGFKTILEGVFKGSIQEVVVAQRDRFTRFGYDLFEWIFKQHGSQLICHSEDNEGKQEEKETQPEKELTDDLMAIITVFSSKYYGRRKYKRQQTNL